jgi:DNA-directed RNA polymerase specialized sigma24 family protein
MKKELQELRVGKINFDTFAQRTRPEWERMAHKLFRLFPAPDGVEPEDLVQEMMFSAWQRASDWDPKFGSDLTTYVTWSANAAAKRWLNVQRNAHRRADRSPGRFPKSESSLRGARDDWSLCDSVSVPPSNAGIDARRIFSRIVVSIADPVLGLALEAWAVEGDVASAAELLRADPEVASALKIWTPKAARRLVNQAIDSGLRIAADIS